MSKNFSKNLSQIKTPHAYTPEHKRKLKNAVLKTAYLNKDKEAGSFGLFDYLRNMSLKKLIPASVLAIFVFTLLGQNLLMWRNTAYAQGLINETINKIESEPLTEEEKEATSTIQILEQLKKEGEIKYLGEEKYPANPSGEITERVIQKFGFTDTDLSTDLIINVSNNKEVFLNMDFPLSGLITETVELKIDADGKIKNLDNLKKKFEDPQLKQVWLKELIKRNNQNWLKDAKELYKNAPEGKWPKDGSMPDKWTTYFEEKIIPALEPIINKAEIYINGYAGSSDPENSVYIYSFDILKLTGQKQKDIEAQDEVIKGIKKLEKFQTEEAKMKIKVLEKALESKNLKLYQNSFTPSLSFSYSGARNEVLVNIYMDFEKKNEDFLSIHFLSENLNIAKGGKWIDVKTENGKIKNLAELEEKLRDPYLDDEVLRFIIGEQNGFLAEYIAGDMDQGAKQYMTPPGQEIVNQLKELLIQAEVPVIERNSVPAEFMMGKEFSPEDADPNIAYSLAIYPLGNSENGENKKAIERLNEIIGKLKASVNSENISTLEILKKALASKDLKYEGKEWGGTQKLRFTDPDFSSDIVLYIKKDGEIQFVIDALFSRSMGERFEIEIDDQGHVMNLEGLKEALKDPNLNESWIKELIKMNNLGQVKNYPKGVENEEIIQENYGNLTSEQIAEIKAHDEKFKVFQKKCDELSRKINDQIRPLMEESEVMIQGIGGGCGEKLEDYSKYLSLFKVAGKHQQDNQNEVNIQKIIAKLSNFDTESAQTKIKILEKVLQFGGLRNYPNAPILMLSAPYKDAKGEPELTIRADFNDETEEFLEMYFSLHPGRGKIKDVEIENGKITNVDELKKAFIDKKLKDPLVRFMIINQNLGWVDGLRKYSLGESWSKTTSENLEQLEEILKEADVLISDRAEGGEGLLFSLTLSALGK